MRKLIIKTPALPASYPIFINSGQLQYPSTWLPTNLNFSTIVIITDNTVKKLYGHALEHCLTAQGYKVLLFSFPAGEKYKNNQTKQGLEKIMLGHRCGQDTLCLALGGGVVGDLAGFIAATYMRGIAYLQIPTTLLAMVDSSVGGKTGINTPQGKNLIGAFWQPKTVVVDLDCLRTLAPKQMLNGLIEVMKMFLTCDAQSFYFLQKNIKKIIAMEQKIIESLIYRAVKIKTAIITQDERESNQRKLLNFGHTIGHAIENLSGYKILHGEAVALGILVEAKIAQILGVLTNQDYQSIEAILSCFGINSKKLKKFSSAKLIDATKADKKVRDGEVYYVLLKTIGQVYQNNKYFVHPVADDVVREAYAALSSTMLPLSSSRKRESVGTELLT